MFSSFTRTSKLFFSSFSKPQPHSLPLPTPSTPKLSFSLLLSFLYYFLILTVILSQLEQIFRLRSQSQYLTTTIANQETFVFITGDDVKMSYKYEKQEKQRDEGCKELYVKNKGEKVSFKESENKQLCEIEKRRSITFQQLQINWDSSLATKPRITQFNISINTNQQNSPPKLIIIDPVHLNSSLHSYLHITLDLSMELSLTDLLPFTSPSSNFSIPSESSPGYSIISSNSTTPSSKFILITSSPVSLIQHPSTSDLSSILSSLSCIVCLFYLLSFLLSSSTPGSATYLSLANKFFILKYINNNNNQLVYQNITSSLPPSLPPNLSSSLLQLSATRMRQKLDIANILKQLKNLQTLIKHNQSRVSSDHLKRTITTMNPYELTTGKRCKILEYMQLEGVDLERVTKKVSGKRDDIFKSPLTASIAYRLTEYEEPHFTQEKIQTEEESKKVGNTNVRKERRGVWEWLCEQIVWVLEKIDVFKYKVGFFFDENSPAAQSSLLGFIKSIKLWVLVLLSYSMISGFVGGQLRSSTGYSVLAQSDCSRSLTIPSIFIFVENSTTSQYLSFEEINDIVSISYNVQNLSYAMKPIQNHIPSSPEQDNQYFKDDLSEWELRGGGMYNFPSNISLCTPNFHIEFQYKCPSNVNCNSHMYDLDSLNFYLLLPESKMLTEANTLSQRLVPFKFNYQYKKHQPEQNIFLKYQQQIHNQDTTSLLHNEKVKTSTYVLDSTVEINYQPQYQQEQLESPVSSEAPSSSTNIRFFLSDKLTIRDSSKLCLTELIGRMVSIWVTLSLFSSLLESSISSLHTKISVIEKRPATWIQTLRLIFSLRPSSSPSPSHPLSLFHLLQRLSTAQNSITSFQSSSNRLMLTTYLKHQLQPFYPPQNNIYSDLPDIGYSHILMKNSNCIENATINYRQEEKVNEVVRRGWEKLEGMNLFGGRGVGVNFGGKEWVSSKISRLSSIVVIAVGVVLLWGRVESYREGGSFVEGKRREGRGDGMGKELLESFEMCLRFKYPRFLLKNKSKLNSADYFTITLKQDNNTYNFYEKQPDYHCVEQTFKSQKLSSQSPFSLYVSPSPSLLKDPQYESKLLSFVRLYTYSLCMTNYYSSLTQQDNSGSTVTTSSKQECSQPIRINSKVSSKFSVKLKWNTNTKGEYYQYSSSFQPQYKPALSRTTMPSFFSTISFTHQAGTHLTPIPPSPFSLLQQILGILTFLSLLHPLIHKYNETTFILSLSRHLFTIKGTSLSYSFFDTILVTFVSLFKLKGLMGSRRNRTLMRSYLETRKLLSYVNVVDLLERIEERMRGEFGEELGVLLRTHVKEEVYLEENLDREGWEEKERVLRKLKGLYGRFWSRGKGMGLSDEQVLEVLWEMQNEEFIKDAEVARRVRFFKTQIGIK